MFNVIVVRVYDNILKILDIAIIIPTITVLPNIIILASARVSVEGITAISFILTRH